MSIMGSSSFMKCFQSLENETVPNKKILTDRQITELLVDFPEEIADDLNLEPFLAKNGLGDYSKARELIVMRLQQNNQGQQQERLTPEQRVVAKSA